MAKNTNKKTEKHIASDNFSKRIENIPAGIVSKIAKIDELKGRWISGARLSPQVLGRLKRSVLITSTGASTRIEGARLSDEDVEIRFGKLKVGEPNIIEADGSSSLVMPYEARIRNLTYAAPITLEITVKKDDQIDSEVVEIGKIPIMVKSKVCNTYGMSKDELTKNYSDPLDSGGYFIINGNERVIVMSEDLAPNQPFIEEGRHGLILRVFSERGADA